MQLQDLQSKFDTNLKHGLDIMASIDPKSEALKACKATLLVVQTSLGVLTVLQSCMCTIPKGGTRGELIVRADDILTGWPMVTLPDNVTTW